MRLRTKYALVFLALVLVLGSVLFVSTEQFKRQLIQQEQAEIDRTANLTAGQVDGAVENRVEYVRGFAGRAGTSTRSATTANLRAFLRGSNFYAAQFIAPNGTIIAFEGEVDEQQAQESIGQNVSDRQYVQRLQIPEVSTVVAAPERSADGNFTAVKIGSKVLASDGNGSTEVVGFFVGAIRLDSARLFTAKEALETGNQTVEIVGENTGGTTLTLDPKGDSFDQTIAASATIESTGWELTVRRDRSRLTERLGTLRAVQSAGLGMVFLSFVLLGVWEYRTNLRQTRRLLEGFTELESGNYDHEVDLEAAEEWRQMSDGFNQLASGLERREEQIREREQQLSVVNRVLRHNLKNEMTVIQGHAEMLPMLDSRDRREDTLETITETAQRLLSHSQKARHIDSAIESTKEGTKPIDCSQVVAKVCQSVSGDYPEVELETEVDEDLDVVAISALEYGVQSIVENAFEHNDNDDPWVRVWTDVEDGTVELSVADNGPGIPAHEIEVLERGTETGLEHGSGVGLWLAYWIVKRSEGTLRFVRRDPTGTIVTIQLPQATATSDAE
jgi:signal transduction histidine kinase